LNVIPEIQAMEKLGLPMAVSKTANTLEEARDIAANLIGGFPIIIRPAFTLGGTGGGIAYNQQELEQIVKNGLDASMTSQVGPDFHMIFRFMRLLVRSTPFDGKPVGHCLQRQVDLDSRLRNKCRA
jgi:formate-dependent phosphoribosylglycinamide formyltransferase (GAR transformylase)